MACPFLSSRRVKWIISHPIYINSNCNFRVEKIGFILSKLGSIFFTLLTWKQRDIDKQMTLCRHNHSVHNPQLLLMRDFIVTRAKCLYKTSRILFPNGDSQFRSIYSADDIKVHTFIWVDATCYPLEKDDNMYQGRVLLFSPNLMIYTQLHAYFIQFTRKYMITKLNKTQKYRK